MHGGIGGTPNPKAGRGRTARDAEARGDPTAVAVWTLRTPNPEQKKSIAWSPSRRAEAMAPVRDRSMIMVRTIRGMNILPTILSGVDRLRIAGPAAWEVTGGHDGVCPMRKSPVMITGPAGSRPAFRRVSPRSRGAPIALRACSERVRRGEGWRAPQETVRRPRTGAIVFRYLL